MAVYNPFSAQYGRLGGVFTRNAVKPSWNPYAQEAKDSADVGGLIGAGLGYGPGGDTPETEENAWRRFNDTLAPGLTSLQQQWIARNRDKFNQALATARATAPNPGEPIDSNTGRRFSDVLGNVDIVRLLQSQTPYALGSTNRYVGNRWR